jgi:hypothetical protein
MPTKHKIRNQSVIKTKFTSHDNNLHASICCWDKGRCNVSLCSWCVVQEAQRIVQHGILKTEIEEYTKALLADGDQLARSIDTQPHIDMMNLAIETISNKQVLNSNVQAQEVRLHYRVCMFNAPLLMYVFALFSF